MNLKDLQYFYDLCQVQSYTDVAKQHKVSQPSISYAIKRLEEAFNCKLIHHDPSTPILQTDSSRRNPSETHRTDLT